MLTDDDDFVWEELERTSRDELLGRAFATRGMLYVERLPGGIPLGWRLVHNVRYTGQRLGQYGFRAWLEELGDPRLPAVRRVCGCGFATELGVHYRSRWPDPPG